MNNKPPLPLPPKINPQIVITLYEDGRLVTHHNFNNYKVILGMLADARDSILRQFARKEYEQEMLDSSSGLITPDGRPAFIPKNPNEN